MDKNEDLNRTGTGRRQLKKADQNNLDLVETDEISILKKLLNKIWGVTEMLQNDLHYIKRIYTKPVVPKKPRIDREERKILIKHKLLTRNKKTG